MRRNKLEILDEAEIAEFLNSSEWGVLGFNHEDCPVLVPLNYVTVGDIVYFHGALAGEKFELSKTAPQCTFLVVGAYAQLPSYFFDPVAACPATQLYKSIIMRGKLRMVDSHVEKAAALQALMEKLQPEGYYEPITADSEIYVNRLKGVAVIAMDVDTLAAKFKLGQDQTPAWRDNVETRLAHRGRPCDLATVDEIKRLSGEVRSKPDTGGRCPFTGVAAP